MSNFDLSDGLDISSVEEPPSSDSCSTADTDDRNFPLDINVVITCERKTMRHAANLIVILNNMKKPLIKFGQGLSDQQQCDTVLNGLIEETTVEMLESKRKERKIQRVNSVLLCTLCDEAKKDVIHGSEQPKLHAITLKAGNHEKKVIFQMTRYTDCSTAKQLVILSIANTNQYLTCSMQDGNAVLNLEECSESDLQFNSEHNMDRFLFYKTITSMSLTKFESVSCNGWFISTSSEDQNHPVEMCQLDNAERYYCFNVSRSKK
ncbi:interleukin-1 beta isoform X2 [Periophthalmus magnuspinnatus]|uniref:interleukin-1 beta isoform X2 n=1 Tax=Periophthalmus magnuspinnatus TaxID=409849 RepID=UPI002436EA08|nr:interleukin-1 beta isoform X2 [Periophthalmus magnuspinnatus]